MVEKEHDVEHEWTPLFSPPLWLQRANKVLSLLRDNGCSSFIDAGCSRGDLLYRILASQMQENSFSRALAIDLDGESLRAARYNIATLGSASLAAYLHPLRVDFAQGDLTSPPVFAQCASDEEARLKYERGAVSSRDLIPRVQPLAQYDAVISIEVLEHINPRNTLAYTEVLFAHLAVDCGARIVIITTPNRDKNGVSRDSKVKPDSMGTVASPPSKGAPHCVPGVPYAVRHDDHKFEMTAAQFQRYCDYVIEAYSPHWTSYTLFGVGDMFTQGCVFRSGMGYAPSRCAGVSKFLPVTYETLKDARFTPFPRPGASSLTPSKRKGNEVRWKHDLAARARLFPWDEIFGELSARPDEDMVQHTTEVSSYFSLPPVIMPFKPVWERMRESVRGAFDAAAYAAGDAHERDTLLTFADVSDKYGYRFFAPFNASLRALVSCLLRKMRRCRDGLKSADYRKRPLVSYPSTASGIVRHVVAWLLYECWGAEVLQRCLVEDSYGSARDALST